LGCEKRDIGNEGGNLISLYSLGAAKAGVEGAIEANDAKLPDPVLNAEKPPVEETALASAGREGVAPSVDPEKPGLDAPNVGDVVSPKTDLGAPSWEGAPNAGVLDGVADEKLLLPKVLAPPENAAGWGGIDDDCCAVLENAEVPVPNEPKAPKPFAGAITEGKGADEPDGGETNALGGVPGGESFVTSMPPGAPALEELNGVLCAPNAGAPAWPDMPEVGGAALPNAEEALNGGVDDAGTDPNAEGCEPAGGLFPNDSDEKTEVEVCVCCGFPNPPKVGGVPEALGAPKMLGGLVGTLDPANGAFAAPANAKEPTDELLAKAENPP
jgi:hypothetical protein